MRRKKKVSQKEVIKSRIKSIVAKMHKLRIEYSDCEDQLSDLSSDLLEIERKEKSLDSSKKEGE